MTSLIDWLREQGYPEDKEITPMDYYTLETELGHRVTIALAYNDKETSK